MLSFPSCTLPVVTVGTTIDAAARETAVQTAITRKNTANAVAAVFFLLIFIFFMYLLL
jgi:hypothetical protein